MPIRVDYQPAGAIGDAAYLGGLGQYGQRQQELFLRAAALGQQGALAQQQLAARMAAQQQQNAADQNRMLFQAQQQQLVDANNQRQAIERMNLARTFETADIAKRREWELADAKARAAEADAARLWGYEAATAADMEKDVGTTMTGYAKQRSYFTPEGTKAYNDLSTKWAAIQKQRAMVRPAQFNELVGQFRDELAKANLDEQINTPKPTPEAFAEETVEVPGKGLFSKDRSGAWRQISKPDASVTERPATFQERYRNVDDFNKDFDATYKAIWDRKKDLAKQEWDAKAVSDAKAAAAGPPAVEPPEHEEVLKAMEEKFAAYQKIQQAGKPKEPTYPTSVESPQPTDMGPPPVPPNLRNPKPPGDIPPNVLLANLPKAGGLPIVPTPEMAAKLPPGTEFLTPDGRRKRVPMPYGQGPFGGGGIF